MAMMMGAAHWFSLDFDVKEAERQLAHMDLSAWGEKGVLTIAGVEHRVRREGPLHGDFLLERDGTVVAREGGEVVGSIERGEWLARRPDWSILPADITPWFDDKHDAARALWAEHQRRKEGR